MSNANVELKVVPVLKMLPRDIQSANEHCYSRKHIDKYIKDELLDCDEIVDRMAKAAELLTTWVNGEYYESKNKRLDQIKNLNFNELVLNIVTGIGYITEPQLLTTVVGQLALRLNMNTKLDAIKTVSEITAIIAKVDLYDIYKEDKYASMKLKSRITFSPKLIHYIENSTYLPPMVCKPETILSNSQSGYLTHNQSVLLKDNHHHDPISLDVINTLSQTPLTINREFISTVEELPNKPLDTIEKKRNWKQFIEQSYYFYDLISNQADEIYQTWSQDKRGRFYANGYHITTMGSAYKKSMLDFANKEIIGVPDAFK